jgi:threonine 3-dehydrogenase
MSNVWVHHPDIDPEVACIFDPFGNAVHTALAFPVLGEDVLISGAGPIGLMAAAVVRHAGARFVVQTDVNPWRLQLARKMGVTMAVNPRETELKDVQKELGMKEGFDVGLEMSGNGSAFRDMLANMSHGGRIALLGIPSGEIVIDWNTVIFNMITLKGIYGRLMYETWYKMTVMLQSGLAFSGSVRRHAVRPGRQGDPGLDPVIPCFSCAHEGRQRGGDVQSNADGVWKEIPSQLTPTPDIDTSSGFHLWSIF